MSQSIKLKIFVAYIGLFALLTSCSEYQADKQIDEGRTENNLYSSQELGWTMSIPSGWVIMSKESLDELTEKGRNALENSLGEKIDISELKYLINFRKDQFNVFQSTSEPYDIEYDGDWEETNRAIREMIIKTYKDRGIRADVSEISIEKVGGLNFQKFDITVFGPKGKKILNQLMYSRLINGFDFGVNINSNNLKHRKAMLEAWLSSSFVVDSHNKPRNGDTASSAD